MKFQSHKLITLGNNQLIVSDGEIKLNDFITDNYRVWQWKDNESLLGRKLVIAQLPSSSPLNGIPLCEEIGVEELAEYYGELVQGEINPCYNEKFKSHVENLSKIDFLAGYNLNNSDGVFTESDMKRMFECGRNFQLTGENNFTELIESLQQSIQLLCNDEGEPTMIDNSFKYKSPSN